MQYVRSIPGSVSKAWNSINPATLSGAIDVIVVEHADGTLACSPFHVRFGKFSLLRPFEKKVEFRVNDVKQNSSMKLGEGGEAFFVFETSAHIPEGLQTSPLVSPASSPDARPVSPAPLDAELEPLDLNAKLPSPVHDPIRQVPGAIPTPYSRSHPEPPSLNLSQSFPEQSIDEIRHSWTDMSRPVSQGNASRSETDPPKRPASTFMPTSNPMQSLSQDTGRGAELGSLNLDGRSSPPPLPRNEAVNRAMQLSKKLLSSNIKSQVNEEGDLMLDITGYKSSEEEAARAELVARQILNEEVEGHYDMGSLIGADEKGNLWIYSSEEAKDAAARRAAFPMLASSPLVDSDALSDPGYHSEETQSQKSFDPTSRQRQDSNGSMTLSTPPDSPPINMADEPSINYAKTLRLTSDQLKALNLKPGPNPMSFSVNRATCPAYMYLWTHDAPIVISDIDGTITKSDALGHVLNMIGRDWTHLGVAKLYSDIVANGYNILYLTSRSVGQADTTRTYINGIVQEGHKLPKGPVIMSPDRTIAALRREIYLRKPEVFKMACLRDIKSLFHTRGSPFYAGFGNRLTDALSYRSVNIPSTRIFTINSNAEVSLDLLSLNKYKTGYTSMREIVDYYFPPVGTLIQEGAEDYTDFNYWRDAPRELDEISMTDSEADEYYDEGSEVVTDDEDMLSDGMAESYMSAGRDSLETSVNNLVRHHLESDGRSLEEIIRHDEEILVPVNSATGTIVGKPQVAKVLYEDEDDDDDVYDDAQGEEA